MSFGPSVCRSVCLLHADMTWKCRLD